LGLIGLGWIWSGGLGLSWAGVSWIGLAWPGSGWIGSGWVGLGWYLVIVLGVIGFDIWYSFLLVFVFRIWFWYFVSGICLWGDFVFGFRYWTVGIWHSYFGISLLHVVFGFGILFWYFVSGIRFFFCRLVFGAG